MPSRFRVWVVFVYAARLQRHNARVQKFFDWNYWRRIETQKPGDGRRQAPNSRGRIVQWEHSSAHKCGGLPSWKVILQSLVEFLYWLRDEFKAQTLPKCVCGEGGVYKDLFEKF